MSESFQRHPETQNTQNQESGLTIRGLHKVTSWIRESRTHLIEKRVDRLDQVITDLSASSDINSLTAQHALITGPDLYAPKDEEDKKIVVAHMGSKRPVTRAERNIVRKTESALRSNTYLSGHVHDLRTTYGLEDPDYSPPELPDRRPDVGNKEVRQAIDERLRRQGLLTDQPAREPTAKLDPSNAEYYEKINDARLSNTSHHGAARAERLIRKYGAKVTKKIEYVEGIARGEDKKVEKLKEKRARLVKKLDLSKRTFKTAGKQDVSTEQSKQKVYVETRKERAARLADERSTRNSSEALEKINDPKQAKKEYERRQNPPNYSE